MKTAFALRHVAFEDLGSLGPVLAAHDYQVRYLDYGVDDLAALDALAPDLTVILGGPIGACDDDCYPLLRHELSLIEQRLRARRPLIGICLGAQLIARVLGARVYSGSRKEIGWKPVTLSAAGRASFLRYLGADGVSVLHWHGDTFDLPRDATLLASSDIYPNQAFSFGPGTLAIQFHAEATALQLERWFVGHACELAAAGIAVPELRAATARHAPALTRSARECFSQWLSGL